MIVQDRMTNYPVEKSNVMLVLIRVGTLIGKTAIMNIFGFSIF